MKDIPPSGVLGPWWPKNAAPHYLTAIPHTSGTAQFCAFPRIASRGHVFVDAPVFLLYGKHWNRHKGFGVVHILAEHGNEIPLKHYHGSVRPRIVPMCPKHPSPDALDAVARFVANICSHRAGINCEFNGMRGDHRPLIIKGLAGTVVLELRDCSETGSPYYSVVTAMTATNVRGTQIGSL